MAEPHSKTPFTEPVHADVPEAAPVAIWALLPCAGVGARAGLSLPKQYQPLAGKAVVLHTVAAFAAVARITQTVVLLAQGDAHFARLQGSDTDRCASAPCGATTRAGTVANGLVALRERGAGEHDWVVVHDAARCLITPMLIDRLIDACQHDTVGGLLAIPVADTIKVAQGERVASTLDRSRVWLAQTPQMFRLGSLQRALAHAGASVTDEASAIESLGQSPRLVAGDATNIKVTVAQDFILEQAILLTRAAQPQSGGDP
ncbi:MAG: 2-C-methyl-D-erythritol 4-phosphate cytidylyltransferase [Burkholderiaceae bacterium]